MLVDSFLVGYVEPRAAPNDFEYRALEQTQYPSPDPRPKPALLFYCYQVILLFYVEYLIHSYRKNELEQKMLLNLHKKIWTSGLKLTPFDEHAQANEKAVTVGIFFTPCSMTFS